MKKILRYIALVGIFIIPFIPLIVSNSLFFPFITGKNFTFRIVVEVVFAAWLILALTDTAYRPRRSWILYILAAFVGIMAVADVFSINPSKSLWSNYERMEGWVALAHLLMYFIVAGAMLAKEKLWDAFFQTSLGVNIVIIVYAFLQIGRLLTINQGGVRVDATLGNATYLAIYAVFHIFIAALYLIRSQDRLATYKNGFLALGFNAGFFAFVMPTLQTAALNKASSSLYVWAFLAWILVNLALYLTTFARQERIIYAAIVVCNAIALYNTATRGAILGFIGGVLVASIIVAIKERESKVARRVSYGVIIIAVVAVVGFLGVRNTQFVRENPVLARFASISTTEKTTLSRFKLWGMALEGFKERPILGWGQESFNYVFNSKYNPELYDQEQWFDRTHNVIFDWLIAGGILGLAAYLAFFASIVYFTWKGSFSTSEKALIIGALVAYFIHNLFVFDNLVSYIMLVSIAAYVYMRTSVRPESAKGKIENRVVMPVVAVALILVVYAVNIRPIVASRSLIQAISVQQQAAPDLTQNTNLFKRALSYNSFGNQEIREQLITLADQAANASSQQQAAIKGKDEIITLALNESKKQISETPQDARAYVLASTLFARAGDVKGSLDLLMTAHKLSPKKQAINFAIGSIYMVQNDFKNAAVWFKEAYELEPSFVNARLYYATSEILNGNLGVADQALAGLPTSTIAASNDIMTAYYNTKQYQRLVVLWEQRVKDDPNSAQTHVSLAAAHLLTNNRKAAIAELETAIKLEPRFKEQGDQYIKDIKAGRNP